MCTNRAWGGSAYSFCEGSLTWEEAKQQCTSLDANLLTVDSAAENDFVASNLAGTSWIGATSGSMGLTWSWQTSGAAFFDGTPMVGGSLDGAYANWSTGEPLLGSCASMEDDPESGWDAQDCSTKLGYVCEHPDRCPADPTKTDPGACGCNRSDADTDHDGKADCELGTRPGEEQEDDDAVLSVGKRPQLDTTMAAALFADGKLSANEYYCLSLDRSDKRNAIFDEEGLAADILAGDIDSDLVPDSVDQCNDTPPLTATDAMGCTETCENVYSEEDGEAVRKSVSEWQLLRSSPGDDCANTTPDMPEMLGGYINNTRFGRGNFALFFQFTRPTCPVRLRIEVSTTAPAGWPVAGDKVLYFETGPEDFQSAYSRGKLVEGATAVVLTAPDFGTIYQDLWTHVPDINGNDANGHLTTPPRILARAMAVYADGKTSGWSNYVQVRSVGAR